MTMARANSTTASSIQSWPHRSTQNLSLMLSPFSCLPTHTVTFLCYSINIICFVFFMQSDESLFTHFSAWKNFCRQFHRHSLPREIHIQYFIRANTPPHARPLRSCLCFIRIYVRFPLFPSECVCFFSRCFDSWLEMGRGGVGSLCGSFSLLPFLCFIS